MASSPPREPVIRLLARLAQLVHGTQYAHGLAPAQWQALGYLGRANRFSRTPGALGQFLGITKGTASQTVATLARKGLVAKARGAKDRRSVTLHLTARGRAELDREPIAALGAAAAGLPAATRDDLAAGLADLTNVLLAARGHGSFGVCGSCRHFGAGAGKSRRGPHRCLLLDEPLTNADARQICAEHQAPPSRVPTR